MSSRNNEAPKPRNHKFLWQQAFAASGLHESEAGRNESTGFIGYVVSNYAKDEGVFWFSYEDIENATGGLISKSTVKRAVKRLMREGWLYRESIGRKGLSSKYRLTIPNRSPNVTPYDLSPQEVTNEPQQVTNDFQGVTNQSQQVTLDDPPLDPYPLDPGPLDLGPLDPPTTSREEGLGDPLPLTEEEENEVNDRDPFEGVDDALYFEAQADYHQLTSLPFEEQRQLATEDKEWIWGGVLPARYRGTQENTPEPESHPSPLNDGFGWPSEKKSAVITALYRKSERVSLDALEEAVYNRGEWPRYGTPDANRLEALLHR